MTAKAATTWAREIVPELKKVLPWWEQYDTPPRIGETVEALRSDPWAVLDYLKLWADDSSVTLRLENYLGRCE